MSLRHLDRLLDALSKRKALLNKMLLCSPCLAPNVLSVMPGVVGSESGLTFGVEEVHASQSSEA